MAVDLLDVELPHIIMALQSLVVIIVLILIGYLLSKKASCGIGKSART